MGLTRPQLVMVAVLLSGTLLAVLNQTLLSPALPAIMASLGVDATTVQWLTSGYSLVEAVIIPLSAFLIGRFTTRQLFLTGIVVFAAGSLLAALAPAFPFLLAGRMLQAACTGAIMPMVMTVILLVFPREKRGSAMGVIGLIIGFAPAVGPSLAGLLVDSVGWRALFFIVTAVAALVLIIGFVFLKNYGDFERAPLDKLSVLLSSVGLVCLLYGLSTFTSSDNLAVTVALIVVGAIVAALFVRRQLHLEHPMLNVSILKARPYAKAVTIIVIVQASLMGMGVITPLYIQGILGQSATTSGLVMLPGAVGGAVLGLIAGRLFDRYGVRRIAIPGSIVTVCGAAGLTLLGMDSSVLAVAAAYTTLSLGLQMTMTPLNTWGLNSLDNRVLQHAQGLSNTLNQVAASFGTALLVSLSALGPAVAPGVEPMAQTFAGDHVAFCVTAALLAVVMLIIAFFVRDPKPAAAGAATADGANAAVDAGAVAGDAWGKGAESTASAAGDTRFLVRDAMNANAPFVPASATMREVVLLMAQHDTSGVPVVDEQRRVVGFVSDGDVAGYLGTNEMSLFDASLNLYRFADDTALQTRLADLLTLNVMNIAKKRVVCVSADDELGRACHVLAEKRIKKVPVVEGDRYAGSLSRRNIIHAIAEAAEKE